MHTHSTSRFSRMYWRHSTRRLSIHFRNTLLTGALAAAPLVVIFGAIYSLESHARPLGNSFGFDFPGLGLLLTLVCLYLFGFFITSLAGRFVLRGFDWLLEHIPGVNMFYHAWKHFLTLPPARTNIFHQVVLIPAADGKSAQVGFCSGKPIPGDAETYCVFLPNSPNPLMGRLMLCRRDAFVTLHLPVEEVFKMLLSTGNYLPEQFAGLASCHLHHLPQGPG